MACDAAAAAVHAFHTDTAAAAADADEKLQTHPSGGSSVGEALYEAKETTVSAASVAALIIWTIAVTGWTGFQVGALSESALSESALSGGGWCMRVCGWRGGECGRGNGCVDGAIVGMEVTCFYTDTPNMPARHQSAQAAPGAVYFWTA